ncbi:hypothetical protein PIROE2DRAFT_6329, partial [Piromyces sp. E2]
SSGSGSSSSSSSIQGRIVTIKSEDFIVEDNKIDKNCYRIDEVYDMSMLWHDYQLNIIRNVKFLGNENGTIFNYNHDRRGVFQVTVNKDVKFFQIENIIFENYVVENATDGIQIFFFIIDSDKLQIISKNCTYRENKQNLFRIDISSSKNHDKKVPYVLFDHCNFM